MPLTTAQQVRLRIRDPYRYEAVTLYGDGTASGYKLPQGQPYSVLSGSATASVPVAAGWSATAATVDHTYGRVLFSAAISANTAFQVDYFWSVFSEDEIAHFTAIGGSVAGAAYQAILTLMFDYFKRARWAAPDGSTYDDTKALDNLAKMKDAILDEVHGIDEGPSGDYTSWAENQQDF